MNEPPKQTDDNYHIGQYRFAGNIAKLFSAVNVFLGRQTEPVRTDWEKLSPDEQRQNLDARWAREMEWLRIAGEPELLEDNPVSVSEAGIEVAEVDSNAGYEGKRPTSKNDFVP